jgi:prepilin-type N-terminal cleavage/methylation domain-containing protein
MKKAFTLIELLVVITIIAVIMAILFPVFGLVKNAALQTSCMSNFKQFGVAFALYGADNDDIFINPSNFDRAASESGQGALDAYVKEAPNGSRASVYLCPSDSDISTVRTLLGNPNGSDEYPTTYAMNVFLQPGNPNDPVPDQCFTPPAQQDSVSWFSAPLSNESNLFENGSTFNSSGMSQSSIDAVSNTDLLFEGVVEGGDVQNDDYVGFSQRGGDYMNVQGFFNSQAHANMWYVSNNAYKLQSATNPWHNRVDNYLFADFHAKGMPPEKEGYDITLHPTDNIWLVHAGRDGSTPVPGHC